jgi:hypothetical protein
MKGARMTPIRNLKSHPYSEIVPLTMIDILSTAVSQGVRSYVTARMADLILGAPKPPGSQTYRLTREELKTCPNYRFYCRLWRSLAERFPEVEFIG